MSTNWFKEFFDIVCTYWDSQNKSEMKHTQYDCYQDKHGIQHIIRVAPANQEICGGPKDGKVYSAPFCFGISAFSAHEGIEIKEIELFTRNFESNHVPELRIDGFYKNQKFALDILLKAPSKKEVAVLEKVDGHTHRLIKYEE